MTHYKFKNLTIDISDDQTFSFGSADNKYKYLKHFFGEGGQKFPVSKHSIKIFKDDEEINSCIIIGSGGATGVYKNSSLIDDDKILLCCCNTIFCLTLPELDLKWKTKADRATCFEIFKQQDDYIVHGELQVTKLDKDGQVRWKFGGADIFVSIDNEEEFKIENDGILLTDFAKTKYKIDFDGKRLWDTSKR